MGGQNMKCILFLSSTKISLGDVQRMKSSEGVCLSHCAAVLCWGRQRYLPCGETVPYCYAGWEAMLPVHGAKRH